MLLSNCRMQGKEKQINILKQSGRNTLPMVGGQLRSISLIKIEEKLEIKEVYL